MQIIIDLSEGEALALGLIAADPAEWAANLVRERARLALIEQQQAGNWTPAIVAALGAGVDPTDEWAILAHAVKAGVISRAPEPETPSAPEPEVPAVPEGEA